MAIKAFTRKTSGPTSSEEFLKDYENLLKRNRGGGSIVGYDTSSNTPMYLGTSVADPMGLGQQVSNKTQDTQVNEVSDISQSVEQLNQISEYLFSNEVSADEIISVYDFLHNYIQNEIPNLTQSQIKQISPVLNTLFNKTNEIITTKSDEVGAYKFGSENPYTPMLPEYAKNDSLKQNYSLGQEFGVFKKTVDDYDKTGNEYIDALQNEKTAGKKYINEMKKWLSNYKTTPQYKYEQEVKQTGSLSPESKSEWERINNEEAATKAGLSYEEYMNRREYANQIQDYKAPEKDTNKVMDEFKNWLSGAKDTASNVVKNVRGATGDTIDALAYAIPGTSNRKDTGFSEWVAGRDTPHTVSATEPENLQAGTGLSRIREDMSYSPSYLASRPDFGEIGLKRAVGNVAGIQDQSALTPKNIVNPSGQDMTGMSRVSKGGVPMSTILPEIKQEPKRQQMSYSMDDLGRIVDAMMSSGYNNRAEAEAVAKADINRFGNEYMPSGGSSMGNVGVGSNNPSISGGGNNYQGGQSNNNRGTGYTYTPRTSGDPMGLANTANIGTPNYVMPTAGVGSNQPSTQSSNQSSGGLMSTISNLLSNLFRRK